MIYEHLRLEKGMYQHDDKTFSQVLESLDPSENYFGTSLEGLDAFQRQLKRFDIKVRGANSDMVEKFFRTSEGAVLFPEYVSRVVRRGMEEVDILGDIIASVTNVNSLERNKNNQDNTQNINAATVKLHKRGRMLVTPYSDVRFQKLDLFSVVLRQIGAHIAKTHLADAVDTLINGNRQDNPTEITILADDSELYSHIVSNFWAGIEPYIMNTLLLSYDVLFRMFKIPEFQHGFIAMNFPGNRALLNPFGATVLRTDALPDGTAIGLDKRFALEMVQCGGVEVEYDKLIDRQFERSAITSTAGFAKIFPDASKVLKICIAG